jgi:2-aminomuconate deaminase
VSQLARTITSQSNADQKLKAIWWLAAVMGQHNNFAGHVFDYQPIWGTGAAVVGLRPSTAAAANLEFDEEDVEVYAGDRNVLSARGGNASTRTETRPGGSAETGRMGPARRGTEAAAAAADTHVHTPEAPAPVGAYPHARRADNLLYLSGVGPRQAGSDAIPGGPVRDAEGRPLPYDIEAQTRGVIENVRTILNAAGAALADVLDVTVFLIDMEHDFETFNRVYAEYFAEIGATRTTVEVRALPTPIAVEFKVIARCPA